MDLNGKVALVTGAAHRVGKAIALALAQDGAHVVVHYGGSANAAQATAREIAALGVEALPVQADLSDPDAIARLFETVERRFGRLDVLVNSASNFMKQPLEDVALDDWQITMAINLQAPFLSTQRAAALMRAVERAPEETALIVNIADLAGLYPWRSFVQHGVSKAGLVHLTKVSARELAPSIRVNAIAPGPVLPPAYMDPDGEAWQRVYAAVPLQRPGKPEHVAQTVVFLAHNDFITGAVIPVDGGESLLGAANH
ncbi:MAG TPA: SDR family oxidoreductase [Aggregatilinea sp.]|uniref:SDR family NAD(P)-dependent oxidoreductase n=1 Tax=Aggregatilinea sp. TaxID=2806333 RepID=UPI002D1CB900|nr:SDR family oxidoreductase [Aggregatilinea sp.]HML24803.1 SDR family oxidoreductase [Aggregatilinea sp.]